MSEIAISTLGDLVEFQKGFDLPKSETLSRISSAEISETVSRKFIFKRQIKKMMQTKLKGLRYE